MCPKAGFFFFRFRHRDFYADGVLDGGGWSARWHPMSGWVSVSRRDLCSRLLWVDQVKWGSAGDVETDEDALGDKESLTNFSCCVGSFVGMPHTIV